MKEEIKKITQEFENGLLEAGLNADNVNYDIIAQVRRKCWDKLENLTKSK